MFKLKQISENLSSMNLSILLLIVILTGLVVALFVGIDKLIDVAMSLKNGNGGFAEGHDTDRHNRSYNHLSVLDNPDCQGFSRFPYFTKVRG